MRPHFLTVLLVIICFACPAQDTLFMVKDTIACYVKRVTPTEVEYTRSTSKNAAIFVVPVWQVYMIKFADGTVEVFGKPRHASKNHDKERKNAFKVNPFSFSMEQILLGYERKIGDERSIELTLGLMNSTLINNGQATIDLSRGGTAMGGNYKVGYRVFISGSRSLHPGQTLSGAYLTPEIAFSHLYVRNLTHKWYETGNPNPIQHLETGDLKLYSTALLLTLGAQTDILSGFLLGFQVGAGFGYRWGSFGNPAFNDPAHPANLQNKLDGFYGSHFVNTGIAYNLCFRAGYSF